MLNRQPSQSPEYIELPQVYVTAEIVNPIVVYSEKEEGSSSICVP